MIWRVAHSAFYSDPETDKPREIDVLALKSGTRRGGRQRLRLHLVIECKSAKDYHVVFLETNYRGKSQLPLEWIGDEQHAPLLKELLVRNDVDKREIAAALHTLRKAAYPKDTVCVRRLFLDAMPSPNHATAFRETNTDKERDLETSVLRRASRAVTSACQSLQKECREGKLEDFELAVSVAKERGESPLEALKPMIRDDVKSVDLFHPIVVIEAPLWLLSNGELSQLPWCRLMEARIGMNVITPWFDVVSRSYAERFFDSLQRYYETVCRRLRVGPI